MLTPSVQSELGKLQRSLALYYRYSGKSLEEVLAKKGRDLGIKLYQGYKAVRWGRGRKGKGWQKGIAMREFRRRVKQGVGIKVRSPVLFSGWDVPLTQTISRRGVRRGRDPRDVYPTSKWQRLVAQEIMRRQAGIGALAAAFLWSRKSRRFSKSQQKHVATGATEIVRNRTGAALGRVEARARSFRIMGFVQGLGVVGARYGIPERAIQGSVADMAPYIRRKQQEEALRAARQAGLRATA